MAKKIVVHNFFISKDPSKTHVVKTVLRKEGQNNYVGLGDLDTERLRQETSGLYYKCFTIIIYDPNDIGLYYKTRDNRN